MLGQRGVDESILVPGEHADKRFVNVVIFDPDVVGVLDRHLDDDHRHSTPLDPTDWAERGLVQRAAQKVTDVVSGWP